MMWLDFFYLYVNDVIGQDTLLPLAGARSKLTPKQFWTSKIDFSFLPEGKQYVATFYVDNRDAHYKTNSQSYAIKKYVVTKNTKNSQFCAPGGGYAISLIEVTVKTQTKGLKKL